MSLLLRSLLLLALVMPTVAAAQEAPFAHPVLAKDAERYEAYLKLNWKPGRQTAVQLREVGLKALGSDARGASRSMAAAVAADPKDSESWTGLARALLAITPDAGSERYELPVNASGAAYTAYLRAAAPAQKAAALAVLADALKRRSMWRPAINALKASLALVENAHARQAFDALYAEHGFRIVDYKVDSDASEPRLCLNFSERVATGQADHAKFLSLDGKDPQSVSAEGQQLCIDGLAHGKRYEVQVRAGLPSAEGELLAKASEIAVYVRDRAASVRFTGRNYVLPSRGQVGHPRGDREHGQGGSRNPPHRRSRARGRRRRGEFPEADAELRGRGVARALGSARMAGRARRHLAPQRGRDDGAARERCGAEAGAGRLFDLGASGEEQRARSAARRRNGSSCPISASRLSQETMACMRSCARWRRQHPFPERRCA